MSELAELLRSAKDSKGRKRVAVLWGAGCSRTAGIPLGGEWAAELRRNPPLGKPIKAATDDFMQVMAELGGKIANEIINEKVRQAKINWAHLALACLLRDGYISMVANLNFDPLVERACSLLNFWDLCVHDLANAEKFDGPRLTYPSLCYLHGRLGSFVKRVTADETGTNVRAAELLAHGKEWHWLVIGYGGGSSDRFFPLFAKSGITRLDWCVRGKKDPPPEAMEMKPGIVPISGADEYLMQLCAQLDIELPELFCRPKSLLQTMTKRVIPYTIPATATDLRQYALSKVAGFPATPDHDLAFQELTKAALRNAEGVPLVRKYSTQIAGHPLLEPIADGLLIQDARAALQQAQEDLALGKLEELSLLRKQQDAESAFDLLFAPAPRQADIADIRAQWNVLYREMIEIPLPEAFVAGKTPVPEPAPGAVLDMELTALDTPNVDSRFSTPPELTTEEPDRLFDTTASGSP